MPEGIAILGSHPQTKMMAPFNQDWLIYACSPDNFLRGKLPRWDQWFEIHVPIADKTRPYPYLKFVEEQPVVWMRDLDSIGYFPGAKEYPEKEMKERFGPFFFTSSIAFMMAKAIVDCEAQGINKMGLWGIMQATPNEYTYQKPGIQYFIQRAAELGIETCIPPEAKALFDAPPEDF